MFAFEDLLSAPGIILLPFLGLLGVLIPLILFCLGFILIFRWRRSGMNGFPGPKTHWIFGNLHQLHVGPLVLQDAVNWMIEYGDVYRLWSVSFPVLVLCGPEPIRDFLKKDTPKGLVYTLFHEWLGEGKHIFLLFHSLTLQCHLLLSFFSLFSIFSPSSPSSPLLSSPLSLALSLTLPHFSHLLSLFSSSLYSPLTPLLPPLYSPFSPSPVSHSHPLSFLSSILTHTISSLFFSLN
jgi:hypothetical protein